MDALLRHIGIEISELLIENLQEMRNEIDRNNKKINIQELNKLSQIALGIHSVCESVLILLENDKVMEAEILERTVVEGTVKMVYLSIGDENERAKKSEEFWDKMFKIDRNKKNKKADDLLNLIPDLQKTVINNYRIKYDEIDEFIKNTNKNDRKAIEHNWSFNQMIKVISENSDEWSNLIGISLMYNQSSNLTHMDSVAIRMIIDRLTEPELTVAHKCRILSDMVILSIVRLKTIYDVIGTKFIPKEKDYEIIKNIRKITERLDIKI